MTKRHHRHLAALFVSRPVLADNRYGVHRLDASRQDVLPSGIRRMPDGEEIWLPQRESLQRKPMFKTHRDASPDDPWLSPLKSAVIQECLFRIACAETASPTAVTVADEAGLDLEAFCQDAELTERQTQVVLMAGEGYGVVEIGRALNLHHSTVEQHLRYGRHKLAGWLPVEFGRALVALAT